MQATLLFRRQFVNYLLYNSRRFIGTLVIKNQHFQFFISLSYQRTHTLLYMICLISCWYENGNHRASAEFSLHIFACSRLESIKDKEVKNSLRKYSQM